MDKNRPKNSSDEFVIISEGMQPRQCKEGRDYHSPYKKHRVEVLVKISPFDGQEWSGDGNCGFYLRAY
jgi:hypothetical protein